MVDTGNKVEAAGEVRSLLQRRSRMCDEMLFGKAGVIQPAFKFASILNSAGILMIECWVTIVLLKARI